MKVIQLREQICKNGVLPKDDAETVLKYIEDGKDFVCPNPHKDSLKDPHDHSEAVPLILHPEGDKIQPTTSYFVGVDWVKGHELAVQVMPKMNNEQYEIDYVKMLEEALTDPENFKHLEGLVTIRFEKPSIKISQQQDFLSIFLVTEYLSLLQRIVVNGLKRSYYTVEENLRNKVKGRILIGQNVKQNITKGKITNNICQYQVYDVDSPENQILKKALRFCAKQLEAYQKDNYNQLKQKARHILPYFQNVSDTINITTIKNYKGNPVFKEYNQALKLAQLLLRRYGYNITETSKQDVTTPPFWIDMSKLFELYIFKRLRKIFTKKGELQYHKKVYYQEPDYLLNTKGWSNPYIIDAKYKPKYKESGIKTADARQVSGYARLATIYREFNLDEADTLPIKCLVIYPDQDAADSFLFTRDEEPKFEKFEDYIRIYKVGIKLPV